MPLTALKCFLLWCSYFSCFVRRCLGFLFFSLLASTLNLAALVTFEITGSFSLSFSLCLPLNSLLPTSPGVHQATVRGGAETVRDLAAAATA